MFWFGLLLMSVLAVLLIGWPWLGRRFIRPVDGKQLNVALTRQRLDELHREVNEGLIESQDLHKAEQELKLALAMEQGQDARIVSGSSRWVLLAGLSLALMVSAYSYWHANELDALHDWQAANAQLADLGRRVVVEADPSVTVEELQRFALALRTKLHADPQAPEGWLLLGRLYASLNRLDSAIEAYEKSLSQAPDRSGTLLSLSQALVMIGSEESLTRAKQLLTKLQLQEPDNQSSLGLLAITATQLGDQPLALKSWTALKSLLPVEDPMQASIQQRIDELSGVQGTSLKIKVGISEALRAHLPNDGYLIVFARSQDSNMKMPAAVIRQPLTSLPLEIELSDANAMLPNYNLSSLQQAQVVARISQDADVQSAPGELQGEINLALSKGQMLQIEITIDKELN
ncbi:c-type cytochrome biogenesis protein CcmI [Bowmanella denitrificans]|uniref:C-type cytochrome biogenesis protein CcmI n=1 Tax=Bowmanella denitrificans TaxID=366582 RepID=A0ABN0XR30_9ALTE